jgi:phosphate transport system permease protein
MNNEKKKQRDFADKSFKILFATFALLAVVLLLLITFFIVYRGLQPFMPWNEYGTISFIDFITGTEWLASEGKFGIWHMIVATVESMAIAIAIAVPVAILTAVAIAELMPKRVASVVASVVELLAGIPSIIYGIFGLGFIVPLIAEIPFNPYPQGSSMLAVSIVLAIMVLPTVIAIAVTSIKAVPQSYKEASLGLGASKIQTIFKVILPSAKSGLFAAVVLGIGRAIGETMAIILVAGNVASGLPDSIFAPVRPMTANIALELSYATGLHAQVLFSTALVLFVFVFIINIIARRLVKGGRK